MNLLRFNALANAVSAVRKYKCQETDTNARAEELSQVLLRAFVVDGKPAVKSARLFFLPCTKVTDTAEKAVITETDALTAGPHSKKTACRKGTVMYLDNLSNELEKTSETAAPQTPEVSLSSQELDCVDETKPTAESGAKVVATVRASEESQLILAIEMRVQLAAHVAPFFRILTTMLAAKLTDSEVFSRESMDDLAELYELALREKSEAAGVTAGDTEDLKLPAAIFLKDRNNAYPGCNTNLGLIAGLPNADAGKIPIYDASGNVIGWLGHFEDITETMRLQSQREDFMASLAHDLKVPIIGAIRALDALLQGYVGPLDDKQLDFIRCLHRSHENLLLMVKNLLQVLRYESGKDRFVFEHFDMVGILNECVKDTAHTLESKHIYLQLDAPRRLILSADKAAMKTVLVNLLGNAISCAPDHTQIKVKLHSCGKQANLDVHHGGEPISEEDMEQLFQRLWQGKRFGAGAGLGLFLCRQIAEGHNGTMTCMSSREEGTVMKLSVPIT